MPLAVFDLNSGTIDANKSWYFAIISIAETNILHILLYRYSNRFSAHLYWTEAHAEIIVDLSEVEN